MRGVTKKLTIVLSALFIVALSSLTVTMVMWDREVMSITGQPPNWLS